VPVAGIKSRKPPAEASKRMRESEPSPTADEQDTYAEHRAALEATLFAELQGAATIVLELHEGQLRRVRRR
jgi:hypothetical protein